LTEPSRILRRLFRWRWSDIPGFVERTVIPILLLCLELRAVDHGETPEEVVQLLVLILGFGDDC
jgi:hypothetical protein